MHCSVIIALICYACNYNGSMLCNEGSMGISRYCNSASSVLLLLKPHLVQGLSTRLANHTRAWTLTYKDGSYHYFTCLYPVVISNSISVLEYWHKYCMEGNFGTAKIWRNWWLTKNSPNFHHPNFYTSMVKSHMNNEYQRNWLEDIF